MPSEPSDQPDASSPTATGIALRTTGRSEDGRWRELPATAATESSSAPAEGRSPTLAGDSLQARLRQAGDGPVEPRYQVGQRLGTGATAAVWAVVDRSLDRPLAAKVLARTDADALAGFVGEARITAALEHPNVLPVHDLDLTADGRPFFTMKRIAGRSLGSALEDSAPDARHAAVGDANSVVSIILAVANALAYAHHRGVIHQDVKPDNIVLGEFGEVLLVDWGSAQRLDDRQRRLYGTPLYMSPEQASHEGADQRSDVFCLGATLFHALTLRLAMTASTVDEFWQRKRAGEIDAPTREERRRVPAALLAIALKAMAGDPAGRYPSMEAMAGDLRACQAGLAVSARREWWGMRLARWARRHARTFAITAPTASTALLLTLVLFGDRLKALATWGSPVYVDGFDDPSLRGWATSDGTFAVQDGSLVAVGERDNYLVLRQRFEGDVRIDYDAWFEAEHRPATCPSCGARSSPSARLPPASIRGEEALPVATRLYSVDGWRGNAESLEWTLVALGRAEEALPVAEGLRSTWPRQMLAVRAAIAGDYHRANAMFEPSSSAKIPHDARGFGWLVQPLLFDLAGDRGGYERFCASAKEDRWAGAQHAWYDARYLLGEIDDDAYLAQPYQHLVASALLVVRAIRAEHRGQREAALTDYRAYLDLPLWRRANIPNPVVDEFVAWRARALAEGR